MANLHDNPSSVVRSSKPGRRVCDSTLQDVHEKQVNVKDKSASLIGNLQD